MPLGGMAGWSLRAAAPGRLLRADRLGSDVPPGSGRRLRLVSLLPTDGS
jgi:hypothetical protein